MGTKEINQEELEIDRPGSRNIAIVRARFHRDITGNLLEGARQTLVNRDISPEHISTYYVPGAFELPQAVKTLQRKTDHLDGCIALGAVIRGETPHFSYICEAATEGLEQIAREAPFPVLFGVLTCDTKKQAEERASRDSDGRNKGRASARALLEMINFEERVS